MRLETVTKNPLNLGHSDVTNMRENMEKWGGENIVGVMHLMADRGPFIIKTICVEFIVFQGKT
jgi:hypothetical protein